MTPKNEERLVLAIERIAELLERYLPAVNVPNPRDTPELDSQLIQPGPATPPRRPDSEVGRRVLEHLARLGFTVRKTSTDNALDNALAMTALFMGEHFASLKEFLGRIKSALGYHGPFTLDLKGRPAEAITLNCQLGTYLYKIAFLENYQYQKSPRYLIAARPSQMPAAQRFLTGQWFEIFCREKAIGLLREAGLASRVDYLKNVQARLPDGEEFEFDFLLALDDELFWFEQKTGSYQRHLERYASLVERMGLDANHAFLVLLDVGEETSQVLCELCKMTVCDLESFESRLQTIIDRLVILPIDGADEDPDAELVFHAMPPDNVEAGLP